MTKIAMDISVIIATYNMGNLLIRCLQSLEINNYPKEKFEIIVIDDGSADNTQELIKNFQIHSTLNLKYLKRSREKKYGPGIARNLGYKIAKGNIIVGTDADCIADPDWLKNIDYYINVKGYNLIGGKVISDDYAIFPWKMSPAGQRAIGANFAYSRKKLGLFLMNENFFGHSGQDLDYIYRIEDKAGKIKYIDTMIISHPPHTFNLKQMTKRALEKYNEVQLYKIHRDRTLSSYNILFRPVIFNRISLAFITFFLFLNVFILLLLFSKILLIYYLILSFIIFPIFFFLYLYNFCIMYEPEKPRQITFSDKLKTLIYLYLYLPIFVYARIKGSLKFKFLML